MKATVGTQAIQAVGARKAFAVLRFVTGWGMCWAKINHQPKMPEYVAWAVELGVSSKTCYRDALLFKEAFPQYEDPSPLVRAARGRIARAGSMADSTALVFSLPIR